jgi:hypothetical protein
LSCLKYEKRKKEKGWYFQTLEKPYLRGPRAAEEIAHETEGKGEESCLLPFLSLTWASSDSD